MGNPVGELRQTTTRLRHEGAMKLRQTRQKTTTNYDKKLRQTTTNRAMLGGDATSQLLSASQAAALLGVSVRTFQRYVAERKIIPHSKSAGGHWRFRREDLEAVQQQVASAQPSPILRQKRENVEELNLTLQERKAKRALRELDEEERRRAEQEEAARQAQEREARRARLEAQAERERRESEREQARAEARAAQAQREWEAEWLRTMLGRLPQDVPPDLRRKVANGIQKELPELYETSAGHAEDVVEANLQAVVQETLRPWKRAKEVAAAAREALEQLPFFARGSFGQASEWEARAHEEAVIAISELPEPATFEQMVAAARAAGRQVAQEYEHQKKCAAAVAELSWRLPSSISQQRARAEEAVRAAFAALPVGASQAQFDAARDAALAPLIAAEAQARAEREAQQAKARLEAEADKHLDRVYWYLCELQRDPDGWDFEGKIYEYVKQIREEIREELMEDLPLDYLAGRRRVEQLVDEWLANHCLVEDVG